MKKPEKFTVKARKSVIQVFNVIIALKEKRKTAVMNFVWMTDANNSRIFILSSEDLPENHLM